MVNDREVFGKVVSHGGHKKGYKDVFAVEYLYPTEDFPTGKLVFAVRTKGENGEFVEKGKSFRIDTESMQDLNNLREMLRIIFRGIGFLYGTRNKIVESDCERFFSSIIREVRSPFKQGFELGENIKDDKSEFA